MTSLLMCDRGMLTTYIQRPTEDLHEDMQIVKGEVDFFLDGTKDTESGGFGELAALLGV